jgi:hypothetical protein
MDEIVFSHLPSFTKYDGAYTFVSQTALRDTFFTAGTEHLKYCLMGPMQINGGSGCPNPPPGILSLTKLTLFAYCVHKELASVISCGVGM